MGHLPIEISRITKLILQKDARVQATVTGGYYRRSPLIKGGLEVLCHHYNAWKDNEPFIDSLV